MTLIYFRSLVVVVVALLFGHVNLLLGLAISNNGPAENLLLFVIKSHSER